VRSLKFRYAKAENIICFGPEGIELHFADYGNVVQITGVNLDIPGTEDRPASNATGKSSVQELLSVALFGRTVKEPTKIKGAQIVNTLADKGVVEVQWDTYRVVRTYKRSSKGAVTSKLQVWESDDHIWDKESEKTQGTSANTQRWIEERVGLTHHAFCNVVVFDDSSTYSFLEADGPTKRQIVENLLGLDQYRTYHDNAKSYLKEQKDLVANLGRDYELACQRVTECESRITKTKTLESEWIEGRKQEIRVIMAKVKSKQEELKTTNTGAQLEKWQEAQDEIADLNDEVKDQEAKISRVSGAVSDARDKVDSARSSRDVINDGLQEHRLIIQAAQSDLQKHLDLMGDLESLEEGTRCPTCHGVISNENYGTVLTHSKNSAEGCRAKIGSQNAAVEVEKAKFGKKSAALESMKGKISQAEEGLKRLEFDLRKMRTKISELSRVPKPDGNSVEKVLEAEITQLKQQFNLKKAEYDGDSPYKEILVQAQEEKVDKQEESKVKAQKLKESEKEIPYYEYWAEAFGDRGIRKYVVDGIIPALNARVSHWLQCLIDNQIELTFDNNLQETITRNGNPAFYPVMSKSEKRRINLAVSQAFSYVMMLQSGSCPSLVFLDEVTGGGVDRAGIAGFYNMIFELAKERQVFVTTHNENLLTMLQGCETINLKKQNDITVLLS